MQLSTLYSWFVYGEVECSGISYGALKLSDMVDKMACLGVISLLPDVKHTMPRRFRRAMLLKLTRNEGNCCKLIPTTGG